MNVGDKVKLLPLSPNEKIVAVMDKRYGIGTMQKIWNIWSKEDATVLNIQGKMVLCKLNGRARPLPIPARFLIPSGPIIL